MIMETPPLSNPIELHGGYIFGTNSGRTITIIDLFEKNRILSWK